MSDSGNFLSSESPDMDFGELSNFELSDIPAINGWLGDDPASFAPITVVMGDSFNQGYRGHGVNDFGDTSGGRHEGPGASNVGGKEKKDVKERYAFKTRSDIEILDDGFEWRKYGKKMVKNNPNPRNYYRCSVEGCPVKKRVERDRDDPRFVITTYEGIHNHQGPY